MSDVIDLMVSFPTVVFTVPLVFCLLWFMLGFLVSGLDVGDADIDLDIDHDGSIDSFEHLTGALHLGALGLPLALLILSFGAWASTLLFSLVVRLSGLEGLLTILVGLLLGAACGIGFVWKAGGALGRALATDQAPERSAALGSMCKVRTLEVTPTFGDAEIITGPMRPSIVKVRARKGRFVRGDVALLVDLDEAMDAYWISELEDELHPDL